jgi:ABC-type branched-subunit amino acid transport system ATPase component
MALLETHDLSKSFGALTAVNAVSLRIEAGTLHSIIGPDDALQFAHGPVPAHRRTDLV